MAKGLNFREFAQPTLPITMNDAAGTLFSVTAPTVALAERIAANRDEMLAIFTRGDMTSVEEVWKLAADLISCNREGRHVTVEDLKGRYGMTHQMLYMFMLAHMEFINEIENAKN